MDGEGGIARQVGNPALGTVAPISHRIEPGGASVLTYTYADGVTFFRTSGQMGLHAGQRMGVLDLISPHGTRFGQGVFTLKPGAGKGSEG